MVSVFSRLTADAPPHRAFPNSQLLPSPPTSPPSHPSHTSGATIAQQNSDSYAGSSDAKEQIHKLTHVPRSWRSRYVEKLQLKFDLKPRIMEALETRLKELEQKMLDINPKLQEKNWC
uniref:Uncharacterized protein n=1 Tax=Lactuca sativa TaxID=4236 RepID=A0A9R1VDZ3_LACSA|nr:hypothetical protein LSAT_V11C500236420 [Lactuca sativa]